MNNWPEMLELGGEECFGEYRKAFDRMYHSGEIRDVEARLIVFPPTACRHICFERDKSRQHNYGDQQRKRRERWNSIRAAHIAWIGRTLAAPTEIRWNYQVPRNHSYLLGFPNQDFQRPIKRYLVVTEPINENSSTFLNGYPIQQDGWDKARNTTRGGCGLIYKRPIARY